MNSEYSIPVSALLIHAHTQAAKQTNFLSNKNPPCISPCHQVSSPSSPTHQEKRGRHCKQRHKPPKLSIAPHKELLPSLILEAFAERLNSPSDPKDGALIQAFV